MRWNAGRSTKLVVCFAIVYLVWGSSYLANAVGVRHLPPLLFGGLRFTAGGLLLLALIWAMRGGIALDRTELRHLLVVGACSVLVSNGFNVWALQWVPSNQAALLNASTAFWIALLGTLGARAHPLTGRIALGLAIGFAGVALILWPQGGMQAGLLVPQLGILVGCIGWACGTIYFRTVSSRLDILSFTALQMFLGGLMLAATGLAFGELAAWRWSATGLVSMAYLTLFSSCLAYAAYAWLARNVTPAQVGTYGYVNPAIATLLGWVVLDERLAPVQIAGVVVILTGVVLVSWPTAEPAPEPTG